MLIRTEAPADILVIDRLLKTTYDSEAEARLVMSLRENSHLTLSLVACNDDGEVVGHVMFSPVTVNDQEYYWQGLAPLAIKEEYRCQGIGSRLIKEGLESLAELGYPVCVVLGNPDYYRRFGFEAAEKYGLSCEWDVPAGAFQVTEMIEHQLEGKSGLVRYCPEFSGT